MITPNDSYYSQNKTSNPNIKNSSKKKLSLPEIDKLHTECPIGVEYDPALNRNSIDVYTDIFTMNKQGKSFFMSNKSIAWRLNISKKTVSRSITELVKHKLIRRKLEIITQNDGKKKEIRKLSVIHNTYIKLNRNFIYRLQHRRNQLYKHSIHNRGGQNYGGRQKRSTTLGRNVHRGYEKLSIPYGQKFHGNRIRINRISKSRINLNHHPKNDDSKIKSENHNRVKEESSSSRSRCLQSSRKKQSEPTKPNKFRELEFYSPFHSPEGYKMNYNKHLKFKEMCHIAHKFFHAKLSHYVLKCIKSWVNYSVEDLDFIMNKCLNDGVRGRNGIRTVGVMLIKSKDAWQKRTSKLYKEIKRKILDYQIPDLSDGEWNRRYADNSNFKSLYLFSKEITKHYMAGDVCVAFSDNRTVALNSKGFIHIMKYIYTDPYEYPPYPIYALSNKRIMMEYKCQHNIE